MTFDLAAFTAKARAAHADADRIIPIIAADYAAVVAEKRRAQEACEAMGMRIAELEALQSDIDDFRQWVAHQ